MRENINAILEGLSCNRVNEKTSNYDIWIPQDKSLDNGTRYVLVVNEPNKYRNIEIVLTGTLDDLFDVLNKRVSDFNTDLENPNLNTYNVKPIKLSRGKIRTIEDFIQAYDTYKKTFNKYVSGKTGKACKYTVYLYDDPSAKRYIK